MKPLASLAAHSLWNRRGTAALTVFALAVSVMLLAGVELLRTGARESFARTISGTDLIVGARSGQVNLLLYSVFRIGDPTSNVSWESYRLVERHPAVAWTVPLALGDSHRGFRVLGTSDAYFGNYRYGERRALEFAEGAAFADEHDAVVGADVARDLGYALGTEIVLSHGIGQVGFHDHDEHGFHVTGILARTGTPVDRTVLVSLEALAEIHGSEETTGLSAFLVGMESKDSVLTMQRALNEHAGEALTAVIPGVALQQLWQVVGVADRALLLVAAFVVLAGLVGMVAMILSGLRERRREMAILRAVGARPAHIFLLLMLEAVLLAVAGVIAGVIAAHLALAVAASWLATRYGLLLELHGPGTFDVQLAAAVIIAAALAGLLPAWLAYRNALADGLAVRA